MIFRFWLYFALLVICGAWGWQPRRCADVYQTQSMQAFREGGETASVVRSIEDPGRLLRQNFEIDYRGSATFDILRIFNRIQNEYPRGWIRRSKDFTEFAIPEGRWNWQHLFKKSFEEVVEQLSASKIQRIDFFANGYREIRREGELLFDFEVRRNEQGEKVYILRIDPRIIELVDFHLEPAIANMYLESGLFKTIFYK